MDLWPHSDAPLARYVLRHNLADRTLLIDQARPDDGRDRWPDRHGAGRRVLRGVPEEQGYDLVFAGLRHDEPLEAVALVEYRRKGGGIQYTRSGTSTSRRGRRPGAPAHIYADPAPPDDGRLCVLERARRN